MFEPAGGIEPPHCSFRNYFTSTVNHEHNSQCAHYTPCFEVRESNPFPLTVWFRFSLKKNGFRKNAPDDGFEPSHMSFGGSVIQPTLSDIVILPYDMFHRQVSSTEKTDSYLGSPVVTLLDRQL